MSVSINSVTIYFSVKLQKLIFSFGAVPGGEFLQSCDL